MTSSQQILSNLPSGRATAAQFSSWVKSFLEGWASWLRTCANYWAAASLYDSLRGLSDAELHRRGLSRATLAQDVFRSCDS